MIKQVDVTWIVEELSTIPAITAAIPWWLFFWWVLQAPDQLYCVVDIITEDSSNDIQKNAILRFTFVWRKSTTMKSITDAISVLVNEIVPQKCMKIRTFWNFEVFKVLEWQPNWPWQTDDWRPVFTKNFNFSFSRTDG